LNIDKKRDKIIQKMRKIHKAAKVQMMKFRSQRGIEINRMKMKKVD